MTMLITLDIDRIVSRVMNGNSTKILTIGKDYILNGEITSDHTRDTRTEVTLRCRKGKIIVKILKQSNGRYKHITSNGQSLISQCEDL